jgi:integrase
VHHSGDFFMLTDSAIRSAIKSAKGSGRDVSLSDGGTGLNLLAFSSGSASWQFYHRVGGKQKKVTFGRYPAMTLGEARNQVRQWRDAIDRGQNPFAVKSAKEEITIAELCRLYIESHAVHHMRPRSLADARYYLTDGKKFNISREWADRTAQSITPTDVFTLIDRVKARGNLATANKILNHLRALFGWAVPRYLEASPCAGITKKNAGGADKKRKRTLNSAELRQIWEGASELEQRAGGYSPVGSAFRLLILTGQRASIVTGARFEHFDLEAKTWTISAEQEGTKGIGNLLPLTPAIEAILRAAPHQNGYVFSHDGGKTPIDLAEGKRKLGRTMGEIAPWCPHDLRRTFRTLSSSIAIPEGDATRERLIGHKIGGMDEIYNQYAYFEEKKVALRMMEAKIRDIVTPPPANVIELHPQHVPCAA